MDGGHRVRGDVPTHQVVDVLERLRGRPGQLRVGEILPPLSVEQSAQHRREMPAHIRHALVHDALLPGGIEEEHRVGVLDVERLGLVRHPVDVGRIALGHAVVVDPEEAPQSPDLGCRAGEHREVRARQPLVGAEARRGVAPRIDGHFCDHDLARKPGLAKLARELRQRSCGHRAHLVAERHRGRQHDPFSSPGTERDPPALLVDQLHVRNQPGPLELRSHRERCRHVRRRIRLPTLKPREHRQDAQQRQQTQRAGDRDQAEATSRHDER